MQQLPGRDPAPFIREYGVPDMAVKNTFKMKSPSGSVQFILVEQ
jgi:hypothetical protein